MSCPTCCQSTCRCSELTSLDCACVDPGLETTGAHLSVRDSQFCERRLTNAPGFLYQTSTGKILFSTSPNVPVTALEVEEGDKFGNLVISMGSNGTLRRVVPADGVDGVLKADGAGNLTFEDVSAAFVVPDPLTVTTLNASTANVTDVNVTGTPTFSALATDTITQTIGLNASDELVKGDTPTVSVASFFENPTLLGGGTPNYFGPANANDYVSFANEISDPDGLASLTNAQTLRIDKAGDYLIRWRGVFNGFKSYSGAPQSSAVFLPGIWLTLNSVVVDYGIKFVTQTRNSGGTVGGEYLAVGLTVGTIIQLQLNGNVRISPDDLGTGLSGVGVILTKIK